MLKIIDISNWQGQPDFNKIKASGVHGVIMKASEGVNYRDPQLARNQSECRRLGLLIGYYHFARPEYGNLPEAEAQYFINQVWPVQEGEWLILDMESASYGDRVNWSKIFLDYLTQKLNGTKSLFYTYLAILQSENWSSIANADYGLWYAHYDFDPDSINTPVPYWPVVAMKQYSSSGRVDGINGNVDMNTFFGDENTFKKYGYKTGPIQPPQEEMFLGRTKAYWLQVEKDREDLMKQIGTQKKDIKDKVISYVEELKAKIESI